MTRFGEAKQILPGSLLVLWQISFQLLYGLLDDAIAADLHLPLMQQAWLGLTFLVPYAAMQWRAGQLIDRWSTQRVLGLAALGCAVGAGLFASATTHEMVFAGRLLTGASAAFAFPSVAQLLRFSCSGRQFGLAMAILESCIGFGSAAAAMFLLWAPDLSWRTVSMVEALLALILATWMARGCYQAWRKDVSMVHLETEGQQKQKLLVQWSVVWAASGVYAWEAGMVFAFGGFWSLWLERQQLLTMREVTQSSLLLFLAVGAGTVFFGILSRGRHFRCWLMLIGTTTSGMVLLSLLRLPVAEQGQFHLPALVIFGLSTAVGGLAFGEAGLAVAPGRVAQVVGLVNGIGCLTGGIFQVLPTSLMLRSGIEANVMMWFGLLALIGWLSAIVLWNQRLGS